MPEPAASKAAGRLDAASIGVVIAAAAKRIAVLHRAKGDHNFDDEDLVGRSYGEKLLPFITTLVDPAEPMPPQLMVVADLIEQGETDDILTDLTFAERAPEIPGAPSMEKVISVPAWSSDDEDTYEDSEGLPDGMRRYAPRQNQPSSRTGSRSAPRPPFRRPGPGS